MTIAAGEHQNCLQWPFYGIIKPFVAVTWAASCEYTPICRVAGEVLSGAKPAMLYLGYLGYLGLEQQRCP